MAAFSGVVFTVGASIGAWWLLDRPRSELPSWIEAGATVVGVGAAIVAGFYAARAFLLEFERESRWEVSTRSAQASRVAAWPLELTFQHGVTDDSDGFEVPVAVDGAIVRVRNASDLPIARARLVVGAMVVRGDGFSEELDIGVVEYGHIDPESTIDVRVPAIEPESLGVLMTDSFRETRVFLQFTDAVGRSWSRRTHEGELRDGGTSRERTIHVAPRHSHGWVRRRTR